jgi:DNA-nicking Smr family endonuclease
MTRRLTKADREIWDKLRETVKPLRKRKAAKPAEALDAALEPSVALAKLEPKSAKPRKPAPVAAPSPPKPPASPALAPFEEKTLRRLGRGLVEIDAKIDLHGMRQERADAALVAFLRHAQARGNRIVLVVTGKGKAGGEGRGILRQVVPGWLSRPDLRELVVGFEEAGRRHGGEGALYVRIRRRRATRPPAPALG